MGKAGQVIEAIKQLPVSTEAEKELLENVMNNLFISSPLEVNDLWLVLESLKQDAVLSLGKDSNSQECTGQ